MTGRVLHAQLHLLDRQLIDQSSGELLGKVDDVELDLDADVPVLTEGDDWVEHHVIDKIPGAGDATELLGYRVVENRVTQLFGYERHVRPALLRWLVHRHLGTVWYLPWADIARISPPQWKPAPTSNPWKRRRASPDESVEAEEVMVDGQDVGL